MAFFLLLYVIFVLVWFAWIGVLIWHVLKYHFPNDREMLIFLGSFIVFSAVILLFSIIFISRADWVSVPTAFKGL